MRIALYVDLISEPGAVPESQFHYGQINAAAIPRKGDILDIPGKVRQTVTSVLWNYSPDGPEYVEVRTRDTVHADY